MGIGAVPRIRPLLTSHHLDYSNRTYYIPYTCLKIVFINKKISSNE